MDSELEQLGERIAEQAAHLEAAKHRLLTDLREFDQRGGWHLQGTRSCAHWLAWRIGWDLTTAREHVRVAGKLVGYPAIDDALRRGEVSYSKVRAMLRVATPENEPLLLGYAGFMTASQLEVTCRKYALVQRHGQNPHPLEDQYRRYVRRRDTEDGMVKIEAVLHPEEAELVWTMLNHAATQLARQPQEPAIDDSAESGETMPTRGTGTAAPGNAASGNAASGNAAVRSPMDVAPCAGTNDDSAEPRETDMARGTNNDSAEPRERRPSVLRQQVDAVKRAFSRADALVSLAQGYLRGDRPDRSPIEVMIAIPAASLRAEVVDPTEVGEMGDALLSPKAVRRLSCDAGVVEIVEDEHGVPLSVGRKRRTIAGALKRALRQRDTMCTFPGCTNRLFLEGHHVKHWVDGGETSLLNTTLLCTLHHRFVHEYGYHIEMGPDQRPRFCDPGGRPIAQVPERPDVADLGWPTIRRMNESLAIDATTLACEWDGRPVDHGAVIAHLVTVDRLC
jgi:hypothetical protein